MKRSILFSLVFLFFAMFSFAQGGKSELISSKMTSKILGADKMYSVYLPAGYQTSGVKYPVLYLLHGAWGNYQSWANEGNMKTIATRVIAEGLSLPMIIVMPDAAGEDENYGGKNMGYFNFKDWAYEDFFFKEFMPYIESTYRVAATKQMRAIAGLSMGGGGTMVYAQHHPELFGSACSLSGLVGYLNSSKVLRLSEEFRDVAIATSPVEYVKNATPQQLASLRTVRWWVDCGDDDYLAECNVNLYLAMLRQEVPLQYRMRDGAHTWEYWQVGLAQSMQFISIGFADAMMMK